MLNLTSLPQISKILGLCSVEAIRLKWLCCVFPLLGVQDAQPFQMQGLCALKSQGEEGRVPLPLCPSPGLSLSCLHKKLSPADHFLCDSFQASQLCLSLAVFLCLQPTGCFCSTSSRASIPALAVGWKGFVCVCVLFFFISCFVCVFVVVVVAQFTHSRPVMLDLPSLQQLSDPPTRRQSEQTRNKQCTEKFQSVFRETCYFKGSIEVPLELITVVGEIRQGGSCSVGSQEMEKAEKGKKKKKAYKKCSLVIF